MSIDKNFKNAVIEQVKIENEIKALLSDLEDKQNLVYYIIFGKQVVKCTKKYKGEALFEELRLLDAVWQERGLSPEVLLKIKRFYVPQYPPPPQPIRYFRLDISELDGEDVLA